MLYPTYIQVHLDNIRLNLEGIRRRVGPDRKILVAVKANAYGHGAVQVSRVAQEVGCEWVGVATVPEGVRLRRAGISLEILKFSPAFVDAILPAVKHNITLTVCDKEGIQQLQEVCAKNDLRAKVHLKVDTGMGRIGVTPEEAPGMAAFIERENPNLHLEGVFTHFPVSDVDPGYTREEVGRFNGVIAAIEDAIGRKIEIVHCANSAAVLGEEYGWMDMVRPGIMVYGFYPDKKTPQTIPLKPGMSFFTRVSFVKKVTAGTGISYGHTWHAPHDTWIATLRVGYGDGFNRLFSNTGRVLINGRSYPVVGRVCMDQTMIDLGPETDVKVGDKVVLIGKSGDEEITVDEWAEKLGTITYEVTCQISPRVKRYYGKKPR
ncbi:MAG: alanine racemase [Anaerolineaceae bacterium]|nr:alanine racemase [Anaerolineaceae bacterium]MDD4043437.1 alanine racemase [Anaerolineaceae bacterium]MDD4578189.1 alanine racemase [Anaerolineaceae bacterium]